MSKTPTYIKKAVKNYRNKQYYLQVRFDRGLYEERLRAAGLNAAEVARLVLQELERRENVQKSP